MVRFEQLEERPDVQVASRLDRDVVAEDQIRTVIDTFKDSAFHRRYSPTAGTCPSTIIFAKDDSHADDIVRVVRDEFGKGNDFCQQDHLQDHRG